MSRLSRKTEETLEGVELSQADFEKIQCVHCGGAHFRACPRVKRMVFNNSGGLQEIEFWPEGSWSTENVIWPEDIMEEEDHANAG